MTLNDLKWPFYVKFCFRASLFSVGILWLSEITAGKRQAYTISGGNAAEGLQFLAIYAYIRGEGGRQMTVGCKLIKAMQVL